MNIVIIEDEMPAYKRLQKLIEETIDGANILAHHDSVQASKEWFAQNPQPDLVFLDVHLADGSAFDLLKMVQLNCPVIFTTAFDQYAIDAFKTNSVGYLLKPVKKEELQASLDKLDEYRKMFGQQTEVPIQTNASATADYKKRFVIRFGEHIKTLGVDEIAYCFSENKATYARTFEGRTYPMDNNLDTLETMLDPDQFFRINRQYLICLKSIDEMRTYSKARVIVTLKPPVKESPVVSSERSADFKQWLAGEYSK